MGGPGSDNLSSPSAVCRNSSGVAATGMMPGRGEGAFVLGLDREAEPGFPPAG